MNFPSREPIETQRNYRRSRTPANLASGKKANVAMFVGTRVGVSAQARSDAQGTYQTISEMVWFDVAAYGGFVDIAPNDRMIEIQRGASFVVVDVQDDGVRCTVTMTGVQRPRT